ncbi:hypothetical protein M758_11G131200 [Ceratodon purpureus]|nr:hypothetical protein M758_11G131200 [Ceratodon purpureus]
MEACKRARKDAIVSNLKDQGTVLDAGLWGKLQEHIKLQQVYEKLPPEDLFRLRLVCKAWNHAAMHRLEPKPYFLTIATKAITRKGYLDGVLSYDAASKKFSFKRLKFPLNHPPSGEPPFEVEGLIFCHHPKYTNQQGVFNIHNRTWHAVPQAPETSKHKSAIGMMVDTSEMPYTFKLVIGSVDKKTQVYDSKTRSWSTTSSKVMQSAKSALNSPEHIVTCMCNNGCVYISVGVEVLLIYSMEGDKWTRMNFPEVKQGKDGGSAVHALGAWNGRIFTPREDSEVRNVTVWELMDRTKQEWREYAVMPKEDYDMFKKCVYMSGSSPRGCMMRFVPCFCDGYLLIYNWQYVNGVAEALAMLDLATKKWIQVDLPRGTVGIKEGSNESVDKKEKLGSVDEGEEDEGSEDEDEEDKGSEDEDEEGKEEGKEEGSDSGHAEDEDEGDHSEDEEDIIGRGSEHEEDEEDSKEGSDDNYEDEEVEEDDEESSEDDDDNSD